MHFVKKAADRAGTSGDLRQFWAFVDYSHNFLAISIFFIKKHLTDIGFGANIKMQEKQKRKSRGR